VRKDSEMTVASETDTVSPIYDSMQGMATDAVKYIGLKPCRVSVMDLPFYVFAKGQSSAKREVIRLLASEAEVKVLTNADFFQALADKAFDEEDLPQDES